MTNQLITIANGTPEHVSDLGDLLNRKFDNLLDLVPPSLGLDPHRVARLAYVAYAKTTDLQKCSPQSFFMALSDALKFGIDPVSPYGYGYLIPRWNKKTGNTEANFQVGYKGYMHLARRTGMVRDLRANVVVEGEDITADLVSGQIVHQWNPKADHTNESKFTGAYAVALPINLDDPPIVCLLDRQQVLARRSVGNDKMWLKWPDRQWRKTPIRTLGNGGELELDPTFQALLEYDQEQDEERASEARTVVTVSKGPVSSENLLEHLKDAKPPEEIDHEAERESVDAALSRSRDQEEANNDAADSHPADRDQHDDLGLFGDGVGETTLDTSKQGL